MDGPLQTLPMQDTLINQILNIYEKKFDPLLQYTKIVLIQPKHTVPAESLCNLIDFANDYTLVIRP